MQFADQLRHTSFLLAKGQHAALIDYSFGVSEDLTSRDRSLIFEFEIGLLLGCDFANLGGLKEFRDNLTWEFGWVGQVGESKLVLLVVEISLGGTGGDHALQILGRLQSIVVNSEGLLLCLLLLPLVSCLCKFLAQQAIIEVVVLTGSFHLLQLLLAESFQSPHTVLLDVVSVFVREGSCPVLALEEANLSHASEGVYDGEIELINDSFTFGNLDRLFIALLSPIEVRAELGLQLFAEVW